MGKPPQKASAIDLRLSCVIHPVVCRVGREPSVCSCVGPNPKEVTSDQLGQTGRGITHRVMGVRLWKGMIIGPFNFPRKRGGLKILLIYGIYGDSVQS